jgi:hypothetical protein
MAIVKARQIAITLAGGLVGGVLFVYAVRRVGLDAIADGIVRVGRGLVVIFALGGLRFLVRAECWRLCMPRHVRLTLPHAFSAFLAGDAVGNVTPLGPIASEPTKVLLTRRHLATRASVASLALESMLYTASVLAMLLFGFVLMLATVPVPAPVRWLAVGTVAAIIGATAAGRILIRRFPDLRAAMTEAIEHPRAALRIVALEFLFHALAVTEIYLTLWWLLGEGSPTIVQAVVFETFDRLVTIAFRFVPFRLGIDEATSGAVAPMLAVSPAAGVALAVVRKVRMLFWSGIGLVLVASHRAR